MCCVIYDICEVCDVDHFYARTTCRWRLTALTLFWLDLHPDHPHVPPAMAMLDDEIRKVVEWTTQ